MPPKKKKTATGYKMPEHLPEGTLLTDLAKKQWKLGKSVGTGGFGEIYLAKEVGGQGRECVVKIEPHENGPLFVEMHYYLNAGKPDHVTEWLKGRGGGKSGSPHVPLLRGHGSYMHKGTDNYRFLVIDRLGADIDKVFCGGKTGLGLGTASSLATQVLTCLEYIHSRGYTHNDVKAANLLLGPESDSQEVFLVDFGLAVKYLKGGTDHKPQVVDPRKAHDGTIEYLSRDAHQGCTSRRSDLEVLAHCLVHWTTSSLPWIGLISSPPTKVQSAKVSYWQEEKFRGLGGPVEKFCSYVSELGWDQEPDYQHCRDMFKGEMGRMGGKLGLGEAQSSGTKSKATNGLAEPSNKISPARKVAPKKALKKVKPVVESDNSDEDNIENESPPVMKGKKAPARKPAAKSKKVTKTDNATQAQSSASSDDMFEQTPPAPKRAAPRLPRYAEAGCQTSPAFVAAAKAKRAGQKALAKSEGLADEEVATASPRGRNTPVRGGNTPVRGRNTPVREAKTRTASPAQVVGEGLPDNPTPAMLAILQRRQQAAEEKASKKRKPNAGEGSTPGSKKKSKA